LGKAITYIGLDVHKDMIAVALAEAGGRQEVREYGKIANTPTALKVLAAKLSRVGCELRFCYEAGPCGYGIQRQLTLVGHDCVVVAPSLIPRKPGDRIKTDRQADRVPAVGLDPIWLIRRSAISCAPVWRPFAACARPVSNSPPSCCAMAITTIDRRGR